MEITGLHGTKYQVNSAESKAAFSSRLKELRLEMGLAQKDIASILGIPVSTYANWEQGRTEPSISEIYLLMAIYEVAEGELFDLHAFKK